MDDFGHKNYKKYLSPFSSSTHKICVIGWPINMSQTCRKTNVRGSVTNCNCPPMQTTIGLALVDIS